MAKYVIIFHLLGIGIYVTKKYQSTKYVSGLGSAGLHVGGRAGARTEGVLAHAKHPPWPATVNG